MIFKVSNDQDGREWEQTENKSKQYWIIPTAEQSLKTKPKGARIAYHERVYPFQEMMSNKGSMTQLAADSEVSLTTLYNIKKELGWPIHQTLLKRPIMSRSIAESPAIQNLVRSYLETIRTPWTAKDLATHIQIKLGLIVPKTIIRRIMINKLGMKYKRGLSRLIDYNEERQLWMKQWFAVKLSMLLKNIELLINIDESSFSRLTKKNYSWIPKGKAQIIKNICFRNSCSLVTAITSSGSVIAAKSSGWVNSKLFIIFLKELIRFIKETEQVEQQKVLILLDNASIHRSGEVKEILENENLNIAYIPQYSPELAPIEHYCSKLKQVVIGRSREKNIDWKSKESNVLLKQSMEDIPPEMVRKIWSSLTKEICSLLDLYQNN